jgi:hypothetical protein
MQGRHTGSDPKKSFVSKLPDALPTNYHQWWCPVSTPTYVLLRIVLIGRRCGSGCHHRRSFSPAAAVALAHRTNSPGTERTLGLPCQFHHTPSRHVRAPDFVEAMSSLCRLPAPRGGGEEDRAPSFHCPGGQQGSHHGELPAASSPAARVRGGQSPACHGGPNSGTRTRVFCEVFI